MITNIQRYLEKAGEARNFKKEFNASGKDDKDDDTEKSIIDWKLEEVQLYSMFKGFWEILDQAANRLFGLRAGPHTSSFDDSGGKAAQTLEFYPHSVPWNATYLKDVFYRYGIKKSGVPDAAAAENESVIKGTVRKFIAKNELALRASLATSKNVSGMIGEHDFIRFARDFKIVPRLVTLKVAKSCFRDACVGSARAGVAGVLTYPEFVEAVVRIGGACSWLKIISLMRRKKVAIDWRFVEQQGRAKVLGEEQRARILESQFPPRYNEDFLDPLLNSSKRLSQDEQEKMPRTRFICSLIEEENNRRIEAPKGSLEFTRIFVKLFIYFGSTVLAVPVCRTLFGAVDCSLVNGIRVWDKDENTECFSTDHIVVLVAALVQIVFFLPFLIRYASLGGDPAELRTPDELSHLGKLKYVIIDSWYVDQKAEKGMMELEVGPLTRGTKSGLFDVATVLGKILLVGTAVFQTNNPMMMAVCFNGESVQGAKQRAEKAH